MVAFCGRILALGRWNLQMSWCKCPGLPRGQLMVADKCINTEIGDCSDTTEQNNYAFFNTSKLLRGEFGTF